MITLPLTKGYVTVIGDEDCDLAESKWHVSLSRNRPYAKRSVWNKGDGYKEYLHKVIARRKFGDKADITYADHKNTDSLNNLRENIRLATNSQNVINQGPRSDSKSGLKGVLREKNGSWSARIKIGDDIIHLGIYGTPEEAAIAYNAKALEYYGEFAWLNPIDSNFIPPERIDSISVNNLARRWNYERSVIFRQVKSGALPSFWKNKRDLAIPMSAVLEREHLHEKV